MSIYLNKEAFVYCWRNKTNGMQYIGKHKGPIDDGYISSSSVFTPLYKANPENFERTIIAFGENLDMIRLESSILHWLQADINSLYYNKNNGGYKFYSICKGHSAETRAKIAKSHLGIKPSAETKAKLSKINTGKKASAETRAKHALRVLSDATKLKLSIAGMGRTVSAETRAKISAKKIGIPKTLEARAKMRLHKKTTEHKAKLSLANIGKKASAETRAKLSALCKARKGKINHSAQAKANIAKGWQKWRDRKSAFAAFDPII